LLDGYQSGVEEFEPVEEMLDLLTAAGQSRYAFPQPLTRVTIVI